jgi:pimeloyl-ACP methyl ester carboxylesterase
LGHGIRTNIGIDTHSNDYLEMLKTAVVVGQARYRKLPLKHPSISDFGDDVIELMDALNIQTAGVFGSDTGAMIAADLAVRRSDRVSAAVLDGYVVLEDFERTDLLANHFKKPQSPRECRIWR